VPVPIFPSELADPEKGTGILMVCTFGDATDVLWWREQKLALRQIVGRDGRLVPVEFGTAGWESVDAAAANAAYARIQSKGLNGARQVVVEMLREPVHGTAPLRGEPKPIEHAVKYYEKGDRPLEFISTRQWFVRLLDKKDGLLAKGEQVGWHPDFMRLRYRNWTENLNVDWCVSRQRYFGVPIPVWYPLDAQGQRDYERPIVAERAALPIDPTSDVPPGYRADQRDQPNGFSGETDIFDTWFTSSLTPQISSKWLLDPARHRQLFPADIRPQSHEIIRTWAFYTIAKALLHEDSIPWKHAIVSGWILDPDRKKMSKSRSSTFNPSRSAASAEPPSRARTFTSSRYVSVKSRQKNVSVSWSACAYSKSP
jgi:valyl-tRNA synthetase